MHSYEAFRDQEWVRARSVKHYPPTSFSTVVLMLTMRKASWQVMLTFVLTCIYYHLSWRLAKKAAKNKADCSSELHSSYCIQVKRIR